MITLFRVDDRLIHGQVQTKWISTAGVQKIIIVDNKTAKDPVALQILKIAAPNNIKLEVCDEDTGLEKIKKGENSSNKVMVLFKSIVTVRRLVEKGINIDKLNVGPVSAKPNATMIVKNTYFTEEEIEAAKFIFEKGIKVYFQLVPDDPKEDWASVMKKINKGG